MNGVWISWEKQRRNKGISTALGWDLYEIICNKPRIYRYLLSSIKTVSLILKEKPRIVAAQNPSIILAGLVLLLKKIFSYKLIIDAHNSGIFPLEGRSQLLLFFSRLLQRYADLTLVTNENLKSVVESNNGKAFVLPDRIPSVPETAGFCLAGKTNIAYICTFSEDEPYTEVLKAAKNLSGDIHVFVTGCYKGKINPLSVSKNVQLLGFISEEDYWALLSSVDIIADLTMREDCLVCGAYEGVALGKPLILSDTKATKSYFSKGCVYVKPTTSSIFHGILTAVKLQDTLREEIVNLKDTLKKDWQRRLFKLKDVIASL